MWREETLNYSRMKIHSEDIPRIRGEAATRRQDSRDRDHAWTLWEKSPLKKRVWKHILHMSLVVPHCSDAFPYIIKYSLKTWLLTI